MLQKTSIQIRQIIIVIVFSSFVSGFAFFTESGELIKDAHRQIVALSQTLYNGKQPDGQSLNALNIALSSLSTTSINEYSDEIKNDKEFMRSHGVFDSLVRRFRELVSTNPGIDTLRCVFRDLKWSFLNIFTKYFLGEDAAPENTKILLFSTSVACKCILKMCDEQEQALYLIQSSYKVQPDLIVIDAFSNHDLKEKYDVMLLPTVIVLDKNNKELKRFVSEEKITQKVKTALE